MMNINNTRIKHVLSSMTERCLGWTNGWTN